MSTKKEILHLIAQSETRKAISALLEATFLLDEDLHQEAALQSAKYEQLKKDQRSGVKNMENLEVRLSRINAALVEIVQKIPEGKIAQSPAPETENQSKKTHFRRPLNLILLLLAIVSGIGISWMIFPKLGWPGKNRTAELKEDSTDRPHDSTFSMDQSTGMNRPERVEKQKLSADGSQKQDSKTGQPSLHPPKDSLLNTSSQPFYDRKLETVEGMTRIVKDKKQSFLNPDGLWIGAWFDDAENFNEGIAYVKQNNRYFWIDRTGKCVKGCN